MTDSSDITGLLNAAVGGDRAASDRLWEAVYEDLRRMAHRELVRERGGDSLSTAGLVHEAYFKLADRAGQALDGRRHFFGIACRAMRQVLVDHARRRRAEKRGGGVRDVSLERAGAIPSRQETGLIELDDALTRLAGVNERLVRVVECRFFGGLSFPEISETLNISLRTAERDWARARAYLYRMLGPRDSTRNRRDGLGNEPAPA